MHGGGAALNEGVVGCLVVVFRTHTTCKHYSIGSKGIRPSRKKKALAPSKGISRVT